MIYKAKNNVQNLFDKAQKKRFQYLANDGSHDEVFGRRVFAETEDKMFFMFDNGEVILKRSQSKTDDRLRDELDLYKSLCEFLLDVINEVE